MPYPTSPARYLAPLALLAAALATFLIATSSQNTDGQSSSAPTTTAQAATHKTKPAHKRYVVKSGDTLSQIAEKTGVALDMIESLNDGVDAQALHAGQTLKLAP